MCLLSSFDKPGAAQVLNDCYHQIYNHPESALAKTMAIVIGGDLVSSFEATSRGVRLQSFDDRYSVHGCNDPALFDDADAWTYNHSLYGQQHIDLIFASCTFFVTSRHVRRSQTVHR